MSESRLFGLVEGQKTDSFFFGQICERSCERGGYRYRMVRARELPGDAGGKQALLSFYRIAQDENWLSSTLNDKATTLVFFLDKDVDDLTGDLIISPNIVYTRYYDVENHVFCHGALIRAIAAAASCDHRELSEHPTFRDNWCKDASSRWAEWTAWCLFLTIHGLPGAGYRVVSQINTPCGGPLDRLKYDPLLVEAARTLQVDRAEIEARVDLLVQQVRRSLDDGSFHTIFKGKWFASILEADLQAAFPGRLHTQNAGAKSIAALLATLDFNQPWAEHFVEPVVRLLA